MMKAIRYGVALTLMAGLLLALAGCGGKEPLRPALTGGGAPRK